MLKKTVILICILMANQITHALDFRTDSWNNLQVSINGKNIILSVYIFANNNNIQGNYFFKADQVKKPLSGSLSNGQITLTDLNNNIFSFPVRNSENRGVYQNTSNLLGYFYDKELNVKTATTFLFYHRSEGSYTHRYSDFLSTDAEIEAFAMEVKEAILTGKNEWLSNACFYNLLAQTAAGEFTTIRTKEQFLKNYHRIISNAVISDLKHSHTININYGYNRNVELGIPGMLPNVMIDELTDPMTKKHKLVITSIAFNH